MCQALDSGQKLHRGTAALGFACRHVKGKSHATLGSHSVAVCGAGEPAPRGQM